MNRRVWSRNYDVSEVAGRRHKKRTKRGAYDSRNEGSDRTARRDKAYKDYREKKKLKL